MVFIVFGGCGYIGSHLVSNLLRMGKRVIVVDTLVNSFSASLSDCPNPENLSIYNNPDEFTYSDPEKVEAIFHLAALKSLPESIKKSTEYWENNIGITARVLEVMEDTDCQTLIFSSSAAVYSGSGVFSEEKITHPVTPYGRTKLACEWMIQDFSRLYPTKRFFALRYFNPFGGVENPKKKAFSNLFPALHTAGQTGTVFKVYGNDYETQDHTCVRDFIHITDLIDGHIKCLLYNKPGFHVFNLGSGKGVSVAQIVQIFKTKYPSLQVQVTSRRPGDPGSLVACIDKARQELGWTPRVAVTLQTI